MRWAERTVFLMGAAYATLAEAGDVRVLMPANDRLHDAIYAAAENPCLVELIQQLRRQVHVVRFNAWAQPDRIGRSLAEHRRMLEALRARDGEGLAQITEAHLRVSKETCLSYLETQPAPVAEGVGAGGVGARGGHRRKLRRTR